MNNSKKQFLESLHTSLHDGQFIKLTLSSHVGLESDLKNIYIRLVLIKDTPHLSFIYRYNMRDITKNFVVDKGLQHIDNELFTIFKSMRLFLKDKDISLQIHSDTKMRLSLLEPSQQKTTQTTPNHNIEKQYLVAPTRPYLHLLGIATKQGTILPSMYDKFRQINKFIEIINSLIPAIKTKNEPLNIVDMGSGKGYLTFALYDFLTTDCHLKPHIEGIEMRQNLVDYCNQMAQQLAFEGLVFTQKTIQDYKSKSQNIDMLIALHACDTATDDAIFKGIANHAQAIIVAPCCHKQIRKQLHCQTELKAILKNGILEERQAELLTDGLRALLMQQEGYDTKVFEFISNEHTSKNIMITGLQMSIIKNSTINNTIETIKAQFGIEQHHLQMLLQNKETS